MHGFYRVTSVVPKLILADTNSNSKEIIKLIKEAYSNDSSIILFPELTLTGYSVGDLFLNHHLISSQNQALQNILDKTKDINSISIIGIALLKQNRLYNCAVVIQNGVILGVVPKSYIPNKEEFYEKRYFNSGIDIKNSFINILDKEIPFGVDLLFTDKNDITFGIEICEDLWAVSPPSNQMATNGANIILNLSASNELVGKANYREELVRTQSARCYCAYIYSSSGVNESTSDTIFSGDAIISEYGSTLARGDRFNFESSMISADIDLQKLNWLRLNSGSFSDGIITSFRDIMINKTPQINKLNRYINSKPFVPSNPNIIDEVSKEITDIQAFALASRFKVTGIKKAIIGISGGLDSTLALLSTCKAFEILGRDLKDIIAITMPGFGTTKRTKNNAIDLCNTLGVTLREIDITKIALAEFKEIGHDRDDLSVTYENVQARIRTTILMNIANKEYGLVIGTGDLSEIALGWSTYNGDHMSMYGLNSGIPKTLISYLIEYFTHNLNIKEILLDILDTPISPELLPHKDGEIKQITEDIIGPYELHDFFLYHFVKYGAKPDKILFMANHSFDKYDKNIIKKWLILFLKRFFTQQFKRNAMPDGIKVGTISLSPRADWRMPSEASFKNWIDELTL
jgi:NAD+ synthase (glutamine-hydrolysing)